MSDELILYTNPMSRGRIARWMLEEVGIPYRREVLTFGGTMKAPDYLRLNPMGKVPTLVHGDSIVTECPAICAYLADAFPQAGLAPPQRERADYYRWLFFAAGPLEAAVSNRAVGFQVPEDRRAMIGYGSYAEVIETLENVLTDRSYIAGSSFTAADVYVGSHLMWGMQFGSIDKRPAFEAYVRHLHDRPAHLRATELDDADMKEVQAG
ncbi:Glutathione S-transferase domain protein [Pseudorhizobium banfieldiae]|uniref:Glutathione S-transferase domain protein n=1 Tax=Pseudorhizobium banfieldiae TaxID=1125847 RepID=L0NEL4_9HYPH|nr:glutathione S-transferase family protein [Pseudorhizobium banfieldiae]CAD6606972.1 glutathione S-transferase family protein [arsenite-oxidising bacterium NT-25]CCF19319.1 Glutathione S-transferase domain protein [Pseudorhizobium banfieldiae]